MSQRVDAAEAAPPLAVHARCVVLGRRLDVQCVRWLNGKADTDAEDWKVCINSQVENKIKSSYITAVGVCDAPQTLKNYNFVVVLGYANGVISMAGVDAAGAFHVISHTDKNAQRVLHVEIHIDAEADAKGRAALHSFALLDGGKIIRLAWDTLAQSDVECGDGIIGMRAHLAHRLMVQYASDRMVLRALDTDSVVKTFENVGSNLWGQASICFHPQKAMVAFAGSSAVRYTAAPRWEMYLFGEGAVHSQAISCLQFVALGELIALLTASRDKIAVWDFDAQTLLYSRSGCEFRLCALVDVGEMELILAIFGNAGDKDPWRVTRLTMPADDRMEEVVVKRAAGASTPKRKQKEPGMKKLRRMVDVEAEDVDENEASDVELFDAADIGDVESERHSSQRSPSYARKRNMDVLDMLNDEESITLFEDLERLKRRVAHLERRSDGLYALTPGACPPPDDESSQWVLYWDDAGQITKQGSGDSITLHIHLYSGPSAGYLQRHDRHNCHTAALSARAMVTGSKLVIEGLPHGLVTFHNLVTNEMWERRLKEEDIAAVAVADDFVAVLGECVLYLFSAAGSMLGVYRLKGTPVGLAAKGNLLAVISEASSYPRCSAMYSTRLLWVNGLRGLARNSINRVVDLYDDVLVLPAGRRIAWLSISDQLNLWVADSSGQLTSLVPAMASFHKLGGVSLEWVPSLHLADLTAETASAENRDRIRAFPLYVNDQKVGPLRVCPHPVQLCYVRLKEGERFPHNNAPANFLGYTMRRAPLRIESASGAYMPFSKFHSVMTRDPKLKEVTASGVVEDVAAIPWQQYDEMRHSLTLQGAQLELLMQLQQAYGFWFRDAEHVTQKAAMSMGNVELVHDKWLLRVLRKVKGQRQDGNVLYDVLRMIRYQRCLDTAADILSDQMDGRQRKVLHEASVLLANGPNRDFLFPPQRPQQLDAPEASRPAPLGGPAEARVEREPTALERTTSAVSDDVPVSAAAPAPPTPPVATKLVRGFVAVDGESKAPVNWMDEVFKS
ncbi:DNA-directed RNA polymerase, putative [Babesia caballi]|uniref:DNA-directed RNA polymerase, putative n=1 Tax=Babesia caballi TaxID=5871 RepID=A0AAV4LNY5_BABCB|nr:DNA-directed RNA polymerase, putative [Babesia caballi]